MRLFMVAAGLLLLLSSLRLRAKIRTVPITLYSASLVCGGLGLIVWVPDNSLVLDRALHTSGVGHLLTIWLITLSFTLQFAFVTTLTGQWNRLRLVAYALYAGVLAVFTTAWLLVHETLGSRFPTLSYGQYSAVTPSVITMNVAGSACIMVAGLLGAWGYFRLLAVGHRLDERIGATTAVSVCMGGFSYGALALAQTASNSSGAHGVGLFSLRVPIILASAALAPLSVWSITHLRPLARRLQLPIGHQAALANLQQREERLRQQQEEFYQLRLDMLDAQTLLDDMLARLQHFADPAVVDDVASCCARTELQPYQQRVAIEAAIWATAMRDQTQWQPWRGYRSLSTEEDPQGMQHEVDRAHAFTADTFRVVLLALGPTHVPEWVAPRVEGPGWRRRAAAILRHVLRKHGYQRSLLLVRHAH